VDTINAKKLCLDDVCITKVELQKLLEMERSSADVAPDTTSANGTHSTAGNSGSGTPAPVTLTADVPAAPAVLGATDPSTPTVDPAPVVSSPAATDPAPTDTSAAAGGN
jgi:hypothetical protein